MNITVFGASGGIGTQLVSLAAQRGHQVRAIYRTTPPTPPPSQADVLISPDIFDPVFAAGATRGADVVVTAVGPNFAARHNPRTAMTSPPDLHQQLARTVIAAMKDSAATSRLIAVSTASMGPADDVMGAGPRLLFRFFRTVVTPNLGRVGQDLRAMEEELASSGLDWYAVRPVKLTDGPLTGHVQASDRLAMKPISRADVAWHILALAEDPAPGPQRTPIITTGASRKPRPAETRNLNTDQDAAVSAQQTQRGQSSGPLPNSTTRPACRPTSSARTRLLPTPTGLVALTHDRRRGQRAARPRRTRPRHDRCTGTHTDQAGTRRSPGYEPCGQPRW